jgi:nucleoside-diphosphate-sugar epimerase
VRSLDNDSRGAIGRLGAAQHRVDRVTGDIRDASVVRDAVRGMDVVCHLAYINGTEFFYTRPELILEVATKGIMNVLDAVRGRGRSRTDACVELGGVPGPADDSHRRNRATDGSDVLNPRFSYGGGKIVSELLAVNYGRKYFDHTLICRPHNVYGPDMGREHVIPQFALRMKDCAQQQPHGRIDFPIQGTGEETRSFIYIDDFIRALLCVMEQGERLGIYHIGTEREVSIRELAHMVADACGREIRIVPGELLAGSTPRRCPTSGS